MQTNFCDCGLFVLAFVDAFMKDPTRAGEVIRVCGLPIHVVSARVLSLLSPRTQQGKAEWYMGRRENFREPFRTRTLQLSDEWKKERAAREEAKTGAQEEPPKDENAADKENEESAKEVEEKPKPKQPEATVVDDSSDDDVIISEVRPPPKANRGAKKSNTNSTTGRAARLRGD